MNMKMYFFIPFMFYGTLAWSSGFSIFLEPASEQEAVSVELQKDQPQLNQKSEVEPPKSKADEPGNIDNTHSKINNAIKGSTKSEVTAVKSIEEPDPLTREIMVALANSHRPVHDYGSKGSGVALISKPVGLTFKKE